MCACTCMCMCVRMCMNARAYWELQLRGEPCLLPPPSIRAPEEAPKDPRFPDNRLTEMPKLAMCKTALVPHLSKEMWAARGLCL